MNNQDTTFVGPLLNSVDSADNSELNDKRYLTRAFYSLRAGASVAGFLRLGGAALMVASLSLFLIQGVEVASDLQRYLLLLGQTMLLTIAGFAVGYLLKEPRGARMFFSLGLISIPANFAVLGAMIYSISPLVRTSTDYPNYASWHASSLDELFIAAGVGLLVLIPMSVFCFAVMARRSKWWLSTGYLLSCATLLIPVRDTMSVTIVSSVCALLVIALLINRQIATDTLATSDERFAKALLFIPCALMLARSAMLYNLDFHVALAVAIALHYLMRRLVSQSADNSLLSAFVRYSAATTAMLLAVMLTSFVNSYLPFVNAFLFLAVSSLALNYDLAKQVNQQRISNIIHSCWAAMCFSTIIMDSLLFHGNSAVLIGFSLAGLLIAAGIVLCHKTSFVLGSIALPIALFANGLHLFSFMLDTGWVGLAIAGASTIVAGSLLDRFWPVIKLKIFNHFQPF